MKTETARHVRPAALAAVALACLSAPAFADTPAMPATKELHILKECSGYGEPAPTFCQVTQSNVAEIPKGTKIWYWGPDLGINDPVMFATNATIDAGQNNLATGFCMGDQRDMDHQKGMCAYTAGTGTLAGFHALITVTAAATGDVHWDGIWWTMK